ncbi:MAG: c-type cytochrome domain-containing protein, partial [Planctomycetia bacterium]
MNRSIVLLALSVLALAGVASAADDAEKLTFDDHVLAVFRQRCGSCHNPEKKAGGLDVTTYGGLMAGGGSGAVFEAGDAAASYLYQLITHASEPKMPPDSPRIPESEATLVKRWIDGGLLENKGSKAVAAKKKPMLAAMEAAPTQRPAVTPLPARLPLEPVVRTASDGACCSIATSPWAPLAAVCGQTQILLWRTDTRQLAGVLPFPEGRPHVVVFSRSGSHVLAGGGRGGAAGRVVAWNVEDGRRVLQVGDELDAVLAADISADHSLVALGGPQKVVRIHSAASGEKLHDLRKHTDWITAVSFSPDGLLLATADRSGGVVVWEAATGRDFLVLTGHTGGVNALSWRGDSNMLATGSDDGTIRLWEMENGSQVKSWNAHGGGVAAVEFSRDGRIASVGRDRTPKLWAQDGNQQKAFEATPEIGLTVSFCDETDSVVVGDWAGTIRVMKAADAAVLGTLSTNPPTLAERLATAEKSAGEAASAVEPVTAEATAATGKLAAKQKDFDSLMTAKTTAMSQFEERRKQAETAAAARVAAEAAQAAAAALAKQAEDAVNAAVEAHSRAFAALAATPTDASRAGVVAEGTRLREQRDRQAVAAAE